MKNDISEVKGEKLDMLVSEHNRELALLGFCFLRLIEADLAVCKTEPSPVLTMVFALDALGNFRPNNSILGLIEKLKEIDLPLITDVSGGSILRL